MLIPNIYGPSVQKLYFTLANEKIRGAALVLRDLFFPNVEHFCLICDWHFFVISDRILIDRCC